MSYYVQGGWLRESKHPFSLPPLAQAGVYPSSVPSFYLLSTGPI